MLEDAVDSEYEVVKTRGRVLRTVAANARRGGVHGPAAYGWQREYDPRTRQLVAQTEVPHEGEVIREIFRRVDAGHSLRSIGLDLEARGVRTRKSKAFSMVTIRGISMRAAYAGRRAHKDKVYRAVWVRGDRAARPGAGGRAIGSGAPYDSSDFQRHTG